MKVNFKNNWKNTGIKLSYKSYSVPINKRDIINEAFSKNTRIKQDVINAKFYILHFFSFRRLAYHLQKR